MPSSHYFAYCINYSIIRLVQPKVVENIRHPNETVYTFGKAITELSIKFTKNVRVSKLGFLAKMEYWESRYIIKKIMQKRCICSFSFLDFLL